MRNGYTILDAHCHIYPARIAAKAVEGEDAAQALALAAGASMSQLQYLAADLTEDRSFSNWDVVLLALKAHGESWQEGHRALVGIYGPDGRFESLLTIEPGDRYSLAGDLYGLEWQQIQLMIVDSGILPVIPETAYGKPAE